MLSLCMAVSSRMYDHRPSHPCYAGTEHVGLSPTRPTRRGGEGGEGTHFMHGRSRMTIDPRIKRYDAGAGHIHRVFTDQADIACTKAKRERVVQIHSFFLFFSFILRRMGKNKASAHHTSTYFHTRRVSI